MDAAGDGFADMRLGTVQQPRNFGERQQIEFLEQGRHIEPFTPERPPWGGQREAGR